MKLTTHNWRGEAANLQQVTTSEPVYFTVKAEKETLDEEGNVIIHSYDPNTIEWHVNGEAQEKRGHHFEFTPRKYGTHVVHAQAGKVQTEKVNITFTKGAPVAT